MGSKNKDAIYHILDKYEVYWEDATSLGEWKDMEDAKKDTPAIACTEGFLIKKNKDRYGKNLWSKNGKGEKISISGFWETKEEAIYVTDEIEKLISK